MIPQPDTSQQSWPFAAKQPLGITPQGLLSTRDRVKRPGLPDDVAMPVENWLDPADEAFSNRGRVDQVKWAYEQMKVPLYDEHREMRELGDMFVGKQWTGSEVQYLESMGRVARTFNIMLPQEIAVEGTYLNNRTKIKLEARGEEDVQLAELHTKVLNHALDEADYYHSLRRVFSDALIFRRGWRSLTWEYTGRYADGQLVYRRNNPFDILFDVDNFEIDVNKGRRLIANRFLSGDRISQLYVPHDNKEMREYLDRRMTLLEGPKARERRLRSAGHLYAEVSGEVFRRDKRGGLGDSSPGFEDGSGVSTDYFDSSRGLYRVLEMHERRFADRYFVYDRMSGKEIPVANEDVEKGMVGHILALLNATSEDVRIRTLPEYWVTTVAPGLSDELVLMERPYAVQDQHEDLGFAFKCLSAYDQHPDKGKTIGLMDLIQDQQTAINRNRSTKEDVIARHVNPDLVAIDGAFGQFLEEWQNRKVGAFRRIDSQAAAGRGVSDLYRYETPQPGIAQLLDSDTDILMGWAEYVTGINPNLRGLKQDSGESGVLAETRAARSETMVAPLNANLKKEMRRDGQFAHAIITTMMTDERVIRVLDETNGKQGYVKVNKYNWLTGKRDLDMTEGFAKFDAIIDEESYTATERNRNFVEGMKMLEGVQDAPLRYSIMAKLLKLWGNANVGREMIGEIKKWLAMTYGPQYLLDFEDFIAAQMGMGAGGAGMMPGAMPPGQDPLGIGAGDQLGLAAPTGEVPPGMPGAQGMIRPESNTGGG